MTDANTKLLAILGGVIIVIVIIILGIYFLNPFKNLNTSTTPLPQSATINLNDLKGRLTPQIRQCIVQKLGADEVKKLLQEIRDTKTVPLDVKEKLASCFSGNVAPVNKQPEVQSGVLPQSLLDEFSKASIPTAPISSLITSISLKGDSNDRPITIANSMGDLWFSTWADDDNLYVTWGDGNGFGNVLSDVGVAQLSGNVPGLTGKNVYNEVHPPATDLADNDKPSSLLFMNGRLYGHFYSPLGRPRIGYNAYSDDYGKTWTRVGFYKKGENPPLNASPWTTDNNSNFKNLFFINMGKNYALSKEDYVYAFGMAQEGNIPSGLYLARVTRENILNYQSYEYYKGTINNIPSWTASQNEATPVPGLVTLNQVSVMYHPNIGRYLILTAQDLFESPDPWGPWSYAGSWARPPQSGWAGGYQPGIITKDLGNDYFWFTISGQDKKGAEVTYKLNLGKIILGLNR